MEDQSKNRFWAGPGGINEAFRISLPLILSNSFWALQMFIDRVLLSQFSSAAVAAAISGLMFFWTTFAVLYNIAIFASTFVAQYVGAKRFHRVGPVIWQSLYFSLITGFLFLLLIFPAKWVIALGRHAPELQPLETTYFQCLCFSALPMMIIASTTSFFLGRGKTWTVMLVNSVGLIVNAVLDYAWIFGHWGFPQMGILGAGWATVCGSWAGAILAIALVFQPKFRKEYALLSAWKFEGKLFRRLIRFGFPAGMQWALDGFAFSVFIFTIGRIGTAHLAATSIAFSLNLLCFLPAMGISQAVTVMVGQRLGENRPDLATKSTWSGFVLSWTLMAVFALSYVLFPNLYLTIFQSQSDPETWAQVTVLVPVLLKFVAFYCLFDAANVIFSGALKGAGDVIFVTVISLVLAWPIMVIPSWAAWYYGWGLFWAWFFMTSYVVILAFVFLLRFLQGKWKSMRVIESKLEELEELSPEENTSLVSEPIV